jgi:N-acetylglucosamine kinase-like BadF-type ATPase
MNGLFLGGDVGGTKSHALIVDASGRALGFGVAGMGNWETVGYPAMLRTVEAVVRDAVRHAGISPGQITQAAFGLAGYDWPSQRTPLRQALDSLAFPFPYKIVNDTILGLLAGASQGWGVAVVAGTGCNARGWDPARQREGRMVGMTWSGEGMGAGDLVLGALQAVAAEWGQRGPRTLLTPVFIEALGAQGLDDLIEGVAVQTYQPGAGRAPLVFQAAEQGDAVALALIEQAGCKLGEMAVGVIHQLGFEEEEFEVILMGGLFEGRPPVQPAMQRAIHAVAPGARLVRLQALPVVGAALLAMEEAGLQPAALRPRIIESTRRLCSEPGIPEEGANG